MASPFDQLNITTENLRGFLVDNLNKTKAFTDQIYEGSNISALTDMFSAMTTLMLYYLGQGINQGQFTETEIYENMNRIVRFHDYKPVGNQTPLLNFRLFGQNVPIGNYTIPRFAFVETAGIRYSLNEDIVVYKSVNSTIEEFSEIERSKLLYQGTFVEYPSFFASGVGNETVLMTVDDNVIVDHFNIFVFVKNSASGRWEEFTKTETLVFEKNDAKKYELRFNENKLYELTFGNGSNGYQLAQGDEIAIYYLKSMGEKGEITTSYLNGKKIKVFQTTRLSQILSHVSPSTVYVTDGSNFLVQNDCPSTYFKPYESIEEIRRNAPKSFRGQYKITQDSEYNSFIRSNFSNLIQDTAILSNQRFLEQYYGFYEKLNLFDPFVENRVVHQQLKFGNSCNFNNVYCVVVPKTLGFRSYYLPDNLKTLLTTSIEGQKCTTANFVPIDPIYINLFAGVGNSTKKEDARFQVILKKNSSGNNLIRQTINTILTDYFSHKNYGLGKELKVTDLTSQILGIEGVSEIRTTNTDGEFVRGIQFYYTDLNHPELIAGSVNTNTTFDDVICWVVDDLQYLINSIEFVA